MDLNEKFLEDTVIELAAKKKLKEIAEAMATIKTEAAGKALWPGIKEYFEKEYSTSSVIERKDAYVHINIRDTVNTKEEALLYTDILCDVINILAITNPVYVRQHPGYSKKRNFSKSLFDYGVYCRFSVGDPAIVGRTGIIEASKAYDDGKMVTGFGLADIKTEGTTRFGSGWTYPRGIFDK